MSRLVEDLEVEELPPSFTILHRRSAPRVSLLLQPSARISAYTLATSTTAQNWLIGAQLHMPIERSIEFYGRTHPYVEGRGLFDDGSSLQLLFGLNVTLY